MTANPFGVQNPEHVDAKYIADNFVDVFTDFPRLKEPSNTFIHGARGTGKSMLLRSMEPEVMLLRAAAGTTVDKLPFLAVHIPLRKIEFAAPEINRQQGYAALAIGEHLLVMHIMFRIADLLCRLSENIDHLAAAEYANRFNELYSISGAAPTESRAQHDSSAAETFSEISRTCERDIIGVRQYYTRLPFSQQSASYIGALTGFSDFLIPLCFAMQELGGLPCVPLFVMLDDADNLPISMQRVLNSWVSTRSTRAVCLKITTQLAYATLRTVDNRIIESPHDFAEVNLGAVYTTENDNYGHRVRQIVERRLENAGLQPDAEAFFPRDELQAERLVEIENELSAQHEQRQADPDQPRKGPARARDERARYAVPRLMQELSGSSRSAHTFSYAGFKSLVDLSSGVVRWFLEPASRMYDRVDSHGASDVASIPTGIQDNVVSDWSREFVEALSNRRHSVDDDLPPPDDAGDASLHALGHETALYFHLQNLVEGLGRLFRQRLLDKRASEQRVISVVLRDKPGRELEAVLMLGVRLGYLQRADNAAKEALGGRRPRYILARRLGPYYKLDVSGYAAHLSVTAEHLQIALRDPAAFVRIRSRLPDGDDPQLPLNI